MARAAEEEQVRSMRFHPHELYQLHVRDGFLDDRGQLHIERKARNKKRMSPSQKAFVFNKWIRKMVKWWYTCRKDI